MHLTGGIASLVECPFDAVDITLAVTEDKGVLDLLVGENSQQFLVLLPWGNFHQMLRDIFGGAGWWCDRDLFRGHHEAVDQTTDFRRQSSREHEGLAALGQQADDFLNVRDEAHIHHPVTFVDDQQFDIGKQDTAPIKQVEQAARCCDQYVNAAIELLDLLVHGDTTDQQGLGQGQVFAIFVEVLGHLCRQFTGRGENERTWHPCPGTSGRQDFDHRQGERSGLAGTGLGTADDILSHQDRRDRFGLNWGRLGIAGFHDRA